MYISHRKKEHYCVKYGGWGITKKVLDYLVENQIGKVEIVFHSKKGTKRYITDTKNFIKYGKEDSLGGFEPQIFLNDRYWRELKIPEYRKVSLYV